ncbi:MAG TPA: hypothetical protein PLH11_08140 [Gemmobacter sp.]|nr:hypothetical protein [Gemmobacter sp.]
MNILKQKCQPGSRVAAPVLGPLLVVPAHPATATPSENADLRRTPIYKARAVLSPYDGITGKVSDALPIGTQAKFIAAAQAAAQNGTALNLLLTLRWSSLFCAGDALWMRCLPIPERIDALHERLRKWLDYRRVLPLYIWVREAAGPEHEHLHTALHLPERHRTDFIRYIAHLTEEPSGRHCRTKSEGEIARGELGSWHIACDTQPQRKGFCLAAYLGKGEPSQVLFRGKPRNNAKKPVRGQSFGGREPDGKYDAAQGTITGTLHRVKRFHIAKTLTALALVHKAIAPNP